MSHVTQSEKKRKAISINIVEDPASILFVKGLSPLRFLAAVLGLEYHRVLPDNRKRFIEQKKVIIEGEVEVRVVISTKTNCS